METRGRKKLVLTEEEIEAKKAKKKKYYHEYREKNIERDRMIKAKWRADNKEYSQEYYQDNKEYFSNKSKETYNSDKDKWYQINKGWLDQFKDGQYHVYKIDSANEYVGITNNIYRRMCRHKHDGRDVSNFRILASFDTSKEAGELESFIHDLGYPGNITKYNKYACS